MCLIIVMLTSKDPGPSPMWVVVVCAPLALLNGAGWAMAMWAMMEHLYSAEQKKIQVAQKAEQEKIRVAQRLKFLEAEVEHLRKNLPPSKDTNITELP